MRLSGQLHCPHCKGRLAAASPDALRCPDCERTFRVADGIADFVGDSLLSGSGADRYHGDPRGHEADSRGLFDRIRAAAGDRWPVSLGETIEFGCGRGETASAIMASGAFRGLLVLDTDLEVLAACRSRLGPPDDGSIVFAALSGEQDALRDAVADTAIGTGLLPGIGDVRAFLAMVHRVLKTNGRAAFVVPNRRYYEAVCLAIAEALIQRHARDGVWPEGHHTVLEFLSRTRRLLVHRGDSGFLSGLDRKHLFDSEALEDMGLEAGFASATMIPLDPDPSGAETTRLLCQEAGAPSSFSDMFGTLAAAVGQSFFDLLGRKDSSASMLLWLTKGAGPGVRTFRQQPAPERAVKASADAALAGVAPRWSVELLARDGPDGVVVSVGGWCLCNSDVQWIRLTLGDVVRYAPVWRPRPDVHEVLNRNRMFHPLNTLCSGMQSDLLFDGVHAPGGTHPFRLDIVLTSGVIVSGPAPEALVMDEQMVIAH